MEYTLMTVGIDFHANTFVSDKHWWIRLNRQAHLELCCRSPDTFDRARHIVKPDGTIQVNHGEMCTHESCKAACTRESFKYRGAKLKTKTNYVTPQVLQARIAYLQNVMKWTLNELPNIGGLTLKSYFMILSSVT